MDVRENNEADPLILVVEPDPTVAACVCAHGEQEGAEIVIAHDADEAEKIMDNADVSAAIVEPHNVDGADEVCENLDATDTPFVLHTSQHEPELARLHDVPTFEKPADLDALFSSVDTMIQDARSVVDVRRAV